MKSMILTFMMVLGLTINYLDAQVISCQPCPPGCCVNKVCTPEDCAKMGCDILKCLTATANSVNTADNHSKICCATITEETINSIVLNCCTDDTKSASSFNNVVSPVDLSRGSKTSTTIVSCSTPQVIK